MGDDRIAFDRTPRTQRVSWFLDMNRIGNLELSPPYQRRQVWSRRYQQFFIDSVLRNYPTASLFLATEIDANGRTTYDVIDGKQRLTAIIEFVSDEYPTPDTLDTLGLGGKLFSELDDAVRKSFFSYIFTIEEITGASASELDQVFERLNRNTQRLNKQELRNAQYYDSDFLKKFEEIALHPFWMKSGVVTLARAKRMLDVEFVSDLYVLTERGLQDGTDYLDEIYASYDDGIADVDEVDERFYATLHYLEDVCDRLPLKSTRFKNSADFYSLWGAVLSLNGDLPDAANTAERLADFIAFLETSSDDSAKEYLDAARQGSNKRSNREKRIELIVQALSSSRD